MYTATDIWGLRLDLVGSAAVKYLQHFVLLLLQTLIVQASAFTKYMGNLSVYFDFRGDFVKWEGGPIFLDRTIAEGM